MQKPAGSVAELELDLFSLDEVAERFERVIPAKKERRQLIEELAKKVGCYRQLGDQIFFTEDDVNDLLAAMHAASRKVDPDADQRGWCVFLTDVKRRDAPVAMVWGRQGDIDKAVQWYEHHLAWQAIEFVSATYADYASWRQARRGDHIQGYMYQRTAEFDVFMNTLFYEEKKADVGEQ